MTSNVVRTLNNTVEYYWKYGKENSIKNKIKNHIPLTLKAAWFNEGIEFSNHFPICNTFTKNLQCFIINYNSVQFNMSDLDAGRLITKPLVAAVQDIHTA